VITVWECEIREDFEGRMKLLIEEIIDDEYNDLKSQY
jgi:G:T-mismatch repair DNA endonuclease (very short patch repair protein)